MNTARRISHFGQNWTKSQVVGFDSEIYRNYNKIKVKCLFFTLLTANLLRKSSVGAELGENWAWLLRMGVAQMARLKSGTSG